MIIKEIFSEVLLRAPALLLAVGIFILFWASGRIFKTIALRIMDKKSIHGNISRVLAGIVKNIMLIVRLNHGMSIQSMLRQKKNGKHSSHN